MHDDRQGAEFMSEIQTLAQVTHLSLVKYYGYVVHDDEKILIVEYVANGTLRDHLDCEYILLPFNTFEAKFLNGICL